MCVLIVAEAPCNADWALLSGHTGGVLSKSRISNDEQGLRRPSLENACLLANALVTVTPLWLLGLAEGAPLSETEQPLIDGFRRMDARGQESLLGMARVQAEDWGGPPGESV